MVNVAVIGCGVVAQYHLSALARHPHARIGLICDVQASLAEQTALKHGGLKWTTRPAEVFADASIDAVILALPAGFRTELALQAFRHGKHVLTEKPTATTAADIIRLIAERGDRVAACCAGRYRSFASAKAAHAFLRTGALGAIRTISCRAVTPAGAPPTKAPPAWRLSRKLNGGGILMNWGCYDLDYLLGLLDFRLTPQHVLARTWAVGQSFSLYAAPNSDAETHVTALVTFAEGCVLTYERAEFSSLPKDHRWQIAGEKGTLTLVMNKAVSGNVVLTTPDPVAGTTTRVLWEGDESKLTLDYDGVVFDFIEAIEGKRPPQTTLEDALLIARISDGIYASADGGAPVGLAPSP